MPQDGKMLLLLGGLGVGGYFIYEWLKKPSAPPPPAPAPAPTPGTTQTMQQSQQPVSISTAPPATPPPTPPPPPLPQPSAADLQKALNMTTATADQWNYAYKQVTGYGIEQAYGTDFDSIYGPVGSDGTRPIGNGGLISADAFLHYPGYQGKTLRTSLSGLGLLTSSNFFVPQVNLPGSMASFVPPVAIPLFVPLASNGGRTQTGLGWLRGLGQDWATDPCLAPTMVATPECAAKVAAQMAALPCYGPLVQAGCTGSGPEAVSQQCTVMRELCTPYNPSGQFIYPGTQAPAPAPASTSNLVPIVLIGGGVLLSVMMMMMEK